jgi:hypothetical protein
VQQGLELLRAGCCRLRGAGRACLLRPLWLCPPCRVRFPASLRLLPGAGFREQQGIGRGRLPCGIRPPLNRGTTTTIRNTPCSWDTPSSTCPMWPPHSISGSGPSACACALCTIPAPMASWTRRHHLAFAAHALGDSNFPGGHWRGHSSTAPGV